MRSSPSFSTFPSGARIYGFTEMFTKCVGEIESS